MRNNRRAIDRNLKIDGGRINQMQLGHCLNCEATGKVGAFPTGLSEEDQKLPSATDNHHRKGYSQV